MTEGYQVIELVQGFPGRSTRHGGLGWSSVTLLRGRDRLVLVDSGGFGMRSMLATRLAEQRIDPAEVTDVLLTHAHYDHAANYPLFGSATVHIGAAELDWAVRQGPTFSPLPELYARDLAANPRTERVAPDPDSWTEVLPGIEAMSAPGHTPGSLVYRVAGAAGRAGAGGVAVAAGIAAADGVAAAGGVAGAAGIAAAGGVGGIVLFTGDAAKNRAELLSGEVDMTLDRDASRATVARIRSAWRAGTDVLVVPGHDLPMRWPADAPAPHYVGTRRAGIQAWFGDDLTSTYDVDLTGRP